MESFVILAMAESITLSECLKILCNINVIIYRLIWLFCHKHFSINEKQNKSLYRLLYKSSRIIKNRTINFNTRYLEISKHKKAAIKSGFKAIGLQICPIMMGMLTRKIRVVALDDLRRTIYVAHPFERH